MTTTSSDKPEFDLVLDEPAPMKTIEYVEGDLVKVKCYFTGNPTLILKDGLYIRLAFTECGVNYHVVLTEYYGEVTLPDQGFQK